MLTSIYYLGTGTACIAGGLYVGAGKSTEPTDLMPMKSTNNKFETRFGADREAANVANLYFLKITGQRIGPNDEVIEAAATSVSLVSAFIEILGFIAGENSRGGSITHNKCVIGTSIGTCFLTSPSMPSPKSQGCVVSADNG